MSTPSRTVKHAAAEAAVSWLDWLGSRKTKHAIIASAVLGVGAATGLLPAALALYAIAGAWGVATVAQGYADRGGVS